MSYLLSKKGIEKKILVMMIEKSKEQNNDFSLNVSKDNPAYHLYLKLGFVVIDGDGISYTINYKF